MPTMTVMKLGGTSVAHPATPALLSETIAARKGRDLLIVFSALAGVTDLLVRLAACLVCERLVELNAILAQIGALHRRFLHKVDFAMGAEVLEPILHELEVRSRGLVRGDGLPADLDDRDDLLAYGERLSSRLYWALLKARGVETRLVDARRVIVTDGGFSAAQPLAGPTRPRLQQFFNSTGREGQVYLTQGFIGAVEGQTTTLGRGGSDYSATFLGALLAAEKVIIWTDTPGILTADPHRIPGARTLSELSYAEAQALALNGAKILHHRCIEPVQRAEVPVEVRSMMEPASAFTYIGDGIAPGPTRFALSSAPFSLQTDAMSLRLAEGAYDLDLVGWCGDRLETRTGMQVSQALPPDLDIQSELALVFLMKMDLSSSVRDDCLNLLVRQGIPVFFVSKPRQRDHLTLIVPRAAQFGAVAVLHDHLTRLFDNPKPAPAADSPLRPPLNGHRVPEIDPSRFFS